MNEYGDRLVKAAKKYLTLIQDIELEIINDQWLVVPGEDEVTFIYVTEGWFHPFPHEEFKDISGEWFKNHSDLVDVQVSGDVIGFNILGEDRAMIQHLKEVSHEAIF